MSTPDPPADGAAAPAPPPAAVELLRVPVTATTHAALLQQVAHLAVTTVPGSMATSITQLKGGRPSTVAVTADLWRQVEDEQFARGDGPCLHAAREHVTVHIDDTRSEPRWPTVAAAATANGARSMLSIPMTVGTDLAGSLNLYGRSPAVFDESATQIAEAFAAYAGVVAVNAHAYASATELAENLQKAMLSRASIEQAKGIIMAERRCSPDDAFQVLVTLSQQTNRKLRDVALALVEEAVGAS